MTQPTDRPGINHLTSDGLDDLYREIDTLRAVCEGNKRHVQIVIADLDAALTRAERAEATIECVRALHARNAHTGDCEHCSARDYPDYAVPHPCPTAAALDQHGQTPKETT